VNLGILRHGNDVTKLCCSISLTVVIFLSVNVFISVT
jgi:hypothetical protein